MLQVVPGPLLSLESRADVLRATVPSSLWGGRSGWRHFNCCCGISKERLDLGRGVAGSSAHWRLVIDNARYQGRSLNSEFYVRPRRWKPRRGGAQALLLSVLQSHAAADRSALVPRRYESYQ
jgi:hypothetical protein